jgi:glyoxylase-like metal-dependent hydrolase (beta-lactamase superfamily II)
VDAGRQAQINWRESTSAQQQAQISKRKSMSRSKLGAQSSLAPHSCPEMFREIAMSFRSLVAAALLGCSALVASLPAQAAAPQLKTSAPGYYRMMLGEFEVTALNDGTFSAEATKLLRGTSVASIRAALARQYLKDPVETSVNGFLVNTGSKLVLIDAGAGTLFGPTLGKLVANLKAAGYQPEQVDEIYITHLHVDHVGGLVADGKMVFPNAIVRADQKEADFWLSEKVMMSAPAEFRDFFKGAMASLQPYVAAGKFKPFDGGTELVPGIRSVPARGHTPGHMLYSIESKGERMVAWGDLVHIGAVQFPAPAVTIEFDNDPKQAMPARKKNFADAARQGYYVAISHIAFPGIGKLRVDGRGYDWIPANYTVLQAN